LITGIVIEKQNTEYGSQNSEVGNNGENTKTQKRLIARGLRAMIIASTLEVKDETECNVKA
jgi:hypothetical protein